jgi:CBS domain-containing protein
MNAREIMTSPVISASLDTPVRDIARLLIKNHISALPILDAGGAPVGMVSEGDLVGRDETERDARREWWLALLAEGEALGDDFLGQLRRSERVASDVMAKPVITVSEDTDTGEIARMLQAYRIKRVPVVRNGQEDVLAPLKWRFERPRHETEPHAASTSHPDEPSSAAAEFRRLVLDFESKEAQRREELRNSAEEKREHEAADLIGKHISEASWRNLIHAARTAAEHGEKEFQLLRFPSQLCSDGGRAINAPDPDWPATLRGEAAEVYLRWSRDLKPHGFHLAGRVMDFPDGVLGDIGLFLVWG